MGKSIKSAMEFEETDMKALFGPRRTGSKAVEYKRRTKSSSVVLKAGTRELWAEVGRRNWKFVVKYQTEFLMAALVIESVVILWGKV